VTYWIAGRPEFGADLHRILDGDAIDPPLSTLTGGQVAERVGQAKRHEAKVAAASTRIRELLRVVVAGRQAVELEGASDLAPLRQAADEAEQAAEASSFAAEAVRMALDGVEPAEDGAA
jgi:hypothetical protein